MGYVENSVVRHGLSPRVTSRRLLILPFGTFPSGRKTMPLVVHVQLRVAFHEQLKPRVAHGREQLTPFAQSSCELRRRDR